MSKAQAGPLPLFIVVYRWRVEGAQDDAFRQQWRDVTLEARELGALGSCLTKDGNGDYLAIAAWRSEKARSDAFAEMTPRPALPAVKLVCETKLEVLDDLWITSPFGI
jgi:hypothetical protein